MASIYCISGTQQMIQSELAHRTPLFLTVNGKLFFNHFLKIKEELSLQGGA